MGNRGRGCKRLVEKVIRYGARRLWQTGAGEAYEIRGLVGNQDSAKFVSHGKRETEI